MTQPLDTALVAAAKGGARLAVRGGAPAHQAAGKAPGRRRQDADLRDGLRTLRPAAHRHLRRGGAHGHGAPRLRGVDRGQAQDAADLLLRRHGRPEEGAGQRAQQGHAGGAHRQAAVVGAGPLQQRVSELCRAQQRAPAPLPRPLRLRVRVPLRHRVLQGRHVRRDAAEDARGLRRGDGHHPAHPGSRAPRHLFAVPPRVAQERPGAAGADGRARPEEGHDRLPRSRYRAKGRDPRHGRPRQVPVEGRLGAALDGARRRLRDVRQGPDRTR